MGLKECDKAVFILGAGFSVSCGLPVMRGFMSTARDRYFELLGLNNPRADDFEALIEFQRECRSASWFVERDWDNIEELYTQADLIRLSERSDNADRRCQRIAWAIWEVYRRHNLQLLPNLKDLLYAALGQGLRPVIVTTNYDLVCETSINVGVMRPDAPRAWKYFYPGFKPPWEQHGVFVDSDPQISVDHSIQPGLSDEFVPIVKLHGSVNWLEALETSQKTCAITAIGDAQGSRTGVNEDTFDIPYVSSSIFGGASIAPVIIPPMLGKSSESPVIALQWKAAIDALSAASEIVVLGYSFPQTDVFMQRLIAEGVKHNLQLERLTIVDFSPVADWEGRVRSMFPQTARATKVGVISASAEVLIQSCSQNEWPRFLKSAQRIL